MLRRACPLLFALVLLAGCGDITYQTRYIPRTSELTWSEDHEQLPWRPPAMEAEHYPRTGRPANPAFPHETQVEVGWPTAETHHAGDGCAADGGALH